MQDREYIREQSKIVENLFEAAKQAETGNTEIISYIYGSNGTV